MFGGEEWEFRAPVLVGDTITAQRRLGAVEEKDGRSGPFVLLHYETTFTNQRDEVVADLTSRRDRPMSGQRTIGDVARRRRAAAGDPQRVPGSAVPVQRGDAQPPSHPLRPRVRGRRGSPGHHRARSVAGRMAEPVRDRVGRPRGRMLTLTWQNRRSALPEHDYTFKGVVRSIDDDVVGLEVWAEDGDGTVLMPGTATVRLPTS